MEINKENLPLMLGNSRNTYLQQRDYDFTFSKVEDTFRSEDNTLLPLYVLNNFAKSSVFEFTPYVDSMYSQKAKSLDLAIEYLKLHNASAKYQSLGVNYLIMRGSLMEIVGMGVNRSTKILLQVCLKTKFVNNWIGNIHTPTNYCIIVSKEFQTSTRYKKIFNKVYKEYIQPLSELGLEVLYTEKPKTWYLNPPPLPTFSNLEDYLSYLDNFNDILYGTDSKEKRERVEIKKEIPQKVEVKVLSEEEAQSLFQEFQSESSSEESNSNPGDFF